MNMRSLVLFSTALIISGCNVESAPTKWQMETEGKFARYQATLACETPPDTGTFQNCQVTFQTLAGLETSLRSVQIEGGMPAHGHGMPTAPVTQLISEPGTYRIDGLKFNMPGAWLLGFKIDGESGNDQLVFDFVI